MDTRELALVYQPQLSACGSTIVSVEALLRHDHPERGRISAAEVLQQFNTTELLEALDWWVIERALQDALAWQGVTVAINISATQLRRPDFASRVLDLVKRTGIEPERVELELVEKAYLESTEAVIGNLNNLRKQGVSIALDDFGTGYSSLAYLLRIPIDRRKIDKSFVDGVEFIPLAAAVHALIAIARSINVQVTAEGVETKAQHRFLQTAGCHCMQGYLFSRPVSTDEITSLLIAQQNAGNPS